MGTPGELAFTLQITRKATGLVEEVQLVGRIVADEAEPTEPQPEPTDKE